MKELLIETLESVLPKKVFLQGTLDESEEYPEDFITFFTDLTVDGEHYDDETKSVVWYFTVIFYSSDPRLVAANAVPAEIKATLEAVGFMCQGKGQDIPSDRTTHTGWAMDFIIKENI